MPAIRAAVVALALASTAVGDSNTCSGEEGEAEPGAALLQRAAARADTTTAAPATTKAAASTSQAACSAGAKDDNAAAIEAAKAQGRHITGCADLRSKCDQQPSYTTACCKTCTCDRLDGHFIDNWQHEFVVNQHGCTVLFTYQGTQKMAQLYGKDVQIQGWSKGTIGPQGNNVKFADGGKWHKLAIKALLQVKEVHLDGEQTTTTAATDKEVHLDGEQTTTTAATDAKTTDAAPTEAPCKKDDEKAAIAAAWKNGKHVNGCEDLRSKCDQDESYQRACCATCNCGQLDGHFVDNWEQEIVVSQHGCAIMFTYEGKQKWAKIEGNQLHVQGWAKGKVQPGNWKVTFDDGGTWRRLAARAR